MATPTNVGDWAVTFWFFHPETGKKFFGCLNPLATSAADARKKVEDFFSGFGVKYEILSVKLGKCRVVIGKK